MNPSESRKTDLFSSRWLYAAGTLLLTAVGYVLTYGLRSVMDIFFLDETGYLIRGLNMFPKIPKLWGPVYCFWYKILSFFESVPVDLFYLNFGLMSVLLALVLYAFLLRFRVAWPAALWLSFMVLIASINLTTFPKVSHFAAIFGMIGLMAAYYVKDNFNRYILISLLFLIMSYIRPEFYLAFLICVIGIAAGWMIRRIEIKWTSGILIGAVILIVLLHVGLGMPLGVELRGYKRSFIAFGEHFSWNYSKWNNLDGYLWLTWESVTASEFGNSRSLSEALRENPQMMLRHMSYNLGIYVNELCRTLTSSLLPIQNHPSVLRFFAPLFAGLMLSVPTIRKDFFARIRHHKALFIFLALIALPSMMSCLLVYPRDHYIIIQLPLFIWLLAELLSTVLRRITSVKWRNITLGVMGILAVIYFITPRMAFDYDFFEMRKEDNILNNLTMLNLLDKNSDVLEGKILLSHEGDFTKFTDAKIEFVNALEKSERPFSEFLDEVDPDMIYFTQTIFNNPNYMKDETWKEFVENISENWESWAFIDVSGGEQEFMLVRPELYDEMNVGRRN